MNTEFDLDRSELLALQIKEHLAGLRELEAIPRGQIVSRDLRDRLYRGTKLLWGSSSVLGLESFKDVLQGLGSLLTEFGREAPAKSEILDDICRELSRLESAFAQELNQRADFMALDAKHKEAFKDLEDLIRTLRLDLREAAEERDSTGEEAPAAPPAGPSASIFGGMTAAEINAELDEIEIALQSLDRPSDTAPPSPPPPPASHERAAGEVPGEPPPAEASPSETSGGPTPSTHLETECSRLQELVDRAMEKLAGNGSQTLEVSDGSKTGVESLLGDIERRVESLRRHVTWARVGNEAGGNIARQRVAFDEAEEGLKRFLSMRGEALGVGVHLIVHAPDVYLEESCFEAACRLLEHLTNDGLERGRLEGDPEQFSVLVRAWSDGDTVRVAIQDNGSNWITESRADVEDCLAFYPGLRKGRADLDAMEGLLWVEPKEGSEGADKARFIFSLPVSHSSRKYVLLPVGKARIALPQSAVDAIVPIEEVKIEHDQTGQVADTRGHRIEIADLGLIHDDLPLPEKDGNFLAIFGAVDRRLGLLVDGNGLIASGNYREPPTGAWSLLSSRCLSLLDGTAIPILDFSRLEHHFRLSESSHVGMARGSELERGALLTPEG